MADEGTLQVKLESLLTLVAKSLYSRPDVAIRELLANAVDALTHKQHLVGNEEIPEDGLYQIRVEYDDMQGTLRIVDTGVGMKREAIDSQLSVIGESGTRALKEGGSAEWLRQLIGQFGIGLLASFTLAKSVTVKTRPADGSETGWTWTCSDSARFTIKPTPIPNAGTTVELKIDPEKRRFVAGEALAKSVRLYGDFLPFPIYDRYQQQLNAILPVWEQPNATPEVYANYIRERFELDSPLLIIPIKPKPNLHLGGVLFIPSEPHYDNRNGAVDIYVRRVLGRQDCPEVLPERFRFIGGVVDCAELTPIMSREDVMRDKAFADFKVEVERQVRDELIRLRDKPQLLARILATHGREIKAALINDDSLFDGLADVLPFTRSDGRQTITLQDYTANARMRKDEEERKRIYYFTGSGPGVARFQINQVMGLRGLEVIEITDDPLVKGSNLDLTLIRKYADRKELEVKAAEDRADLLPQVSDDQWQLVEKLFKSIAPPTRNLIVRTSEFEPELLPILILSPTHGELRGQMDNVLSNLSGSLEKIKQIFELAKSRMDEEEGSLMLFLNAKNREMNLFHDRINGLPAISARVVAIELYNLAMQYSGFSFAADQMASVIDSRLSALTYCISAEGVPPLLEGR